MSICQAGSVPWRRGEFICYLLVALAAALAFELLAIIAGGNALLARTPQGSFAIIAILAIITCYFTAIRIRPNFAAGAGAALVGYIGLRLATETGYAIHFAGRGFPLIDPWLAAIDRAMGADWPGIVRWFDGHPLLSQALRIAYDYCPVLTPVSVIWLAAIGHHRRLFAVTTADFLALTFVHLVALRAPAIGAYGYYQLSPAIHPHVALSSVDHTVSHVLALRNAHALAFPETGLLGLVTFPSYHAIYAVQRGWALWAVPRLRWIAAIISGAVAVSAVPQGSHHVIDVVCGIAVAIVTIVIAARLSGYAAGRWSGAIEHWIGSRGRIGAPILV